MRISDWSSDVCSSDLPGEREHRIGRGAAKRIRPIAGFSPPPSPHETRSRYRPASRRTAAACPASSHHGGAAWARGGSLREGPLPDGRRGRDGVMAPSSGKDNRFGAIGRASGRERVGQYVWISVVAVSLKKKTHN